MKDIVTYTVVFEINNVIPFHAILMPLVLLRVRRTSTVRVGGRSVDKGKASMDQSADTHGGVHFATLKEIFENGEMRTERPSVCSSLCCCM